MDKCWFSELCVKSGEQSCQRCVNNGLYYVAKQMFIPKSGIPDNYHFLKLVDLDLTGDLVKLNFYLENLTCLIDNGKGIYLWGKNPGTGKTSLGCLMLLRYLSYSIMADPYSLDNRRVLYLNTTEFLERLRKSMNSPDQDLEILMNELTDKELAPKVILFDDIGAEKQSEWVQERLYSLVNFRVSNSLANIFTSNCSLDELAAKVGARTYSRIVGCAQPVNLSGKDMRRCTW